MSFRGKCIRGKILYTVLNDLVLFLLLTLCYFLLRFISFDTVSSIILMIIFISCIFCFYFFRAITVVGRKFDAEGDLAFIIILKLIFLFLNGLSILVFFAEPILALVLIGINTLLVSHTQYYRIFLLISGRYMVWEGQVLSVKRYVFHHGSHQRGFSAIYYVAQFEFKSGETEYICIDRYMYYRLKKRGYPKANLVWFYFPNNRKYYEVFLEN